MRRLIIMTGATLGALSIGALGASGAVSAAGNHSSAVRPSHHPLPAGEDEDDDGEENGGSGGDSGGGLPATGMDASSLALIGALTLAVGGATYRVATRRSQQR
jgi:LPXTG-motif cell wall-anchored protein